MIVLTFYKPRACKGIPFSRCLPPPVSLFSQLQKVSHLPPLSHSPQYLYKSVPPNEIKLLASPSSSYARAFQMISSENQVLILIDLFLEQGIILNANPNLKSKMGCYLFGDPGCSCKYPLKACLSAPPLRDRGPDRPNLDC